MKSSEVLRRARARIEKPENWTKGALARYATGERTVESAAPGVTCWCALGALDWAEPVGWFRVYGRVCEAIGGPDLPRWNDAPERTHAEVLDAFDRAIALAEQEGD